MYSYYDSSSLQYDDVDLIHGKFIPAKNGLTTSEPVRLFIGTHGVLTDLPGRFMYRYDNLKWPPCKADACVLDPEFLRNNVPRVGVEAIMEEDGFWEYVEAYPWYLLLMSELYKLAGGDYYFLLPMYDAKQLDDRLTWVWRHFGEGSKDRTFLLTRFSAQLLIHSRNDLFISDSLYLCELWSNYGGSSFWWPAIDGNCKNPSKLLSKRVKLLSQVVADLHALGNRK